MKDHCCCRVGASFAYILFGVSAGEWWSARDGERSFFNVIWELNAGKYNWLDLRVFYWTSDATDSEAGCFEVKGSSLRGTPALLSSKGSYLTMTDE